jgi:glutamate/tyrosine decarboxylase-like PLP-dependent enzyme
MTGAQVSKNPVFGIITSGGSESLIMSIYAYRKYFSSRTKPNM